MADFNLTKMAVNLYCPGNVVQQDDAGLPSIMVWIPAFKNSDVLTGGDDSVHPAFIVNDRQIPGFYYSKYENCVYNGKAYSLPAENPAANVNFDEARNNCENKGYGWHMSTAAEWAAIALWCRNNGHVPLGNNHNGRDVTESKVKAIPVTYNNDGVISKVATGTGPLTWSHDNTTAGIWDLNGNMNEWQGGLRIVWGELQILANNDAADPDNPQNKTSTCWKAIKASDGTLVEPESKTTDTAPKTSGSTVKLDYVGNVLTYATGVSTASAEDMTCTFEQITCAASVSDAAKVLLRALALLPDEGETEYGADLVYFANGVSECGVFRGGSNSYGVSAGLFSLRATYTRDTSGVGVGFRSAYIPNI